MSSAQLFPEIKDATGLGPRFAQPLFLPIGIEGQAGAGGTADAGTVYTVTRPSEASALFDSGSSLSDLVRFVLGRGIPQVKVVAATMGGAPTLTQRQTAWSALEDDPDVRIRLTDSSTQADLVALGESCEFAEGINHKQVAFGGLNAGSSSSTLQAAAAAIASKRFVLVGPAVYDEDGVLQNGVYAAAAVAAEVSKNPDIADDLDTLPIPGFTGLEKDTNGMPVLRIKAAGGTPVNDFEDLLQAGVSPLRQGRQSGVEITHLRTTYTVDSTYDALMTRLIADQLFIDVRDYCEGNNFLRRGNTEKTREDLRAGVEALLIDRRNWVRPLIQPDGSIGYNVSVVSSEDARQVIIHYKGEVVRGIQTILVDAELTIPV